MSAKDKIGLGYGTQLNELSSNHETDSENSLSIFDVRSSDEENTPENDRFSKNGYKVVPPPITGNFLIPRADISFAGLDEYAIRNKIIESQTTELNTKKSKTAGKTNDANTEKPKSASESIVSNPKINRDRVIIEDWKLDDEEEEYEVQTVRPKTQIIKTRDDKSGQNSKKQGIGFRKVKACFVCKSTDYLIKDCNFHDKKSQEPKLKNVVNTGQREGKSVWDNTKRINHQNFSKYPYFNSNDSFVPSDDTKDRASQRTCYRSCSCDSGFALSHMTGTKITSDYERFQWRLVAFGSDPKGSKITSKCFKLLDESEVVLRALRKVDVYNLDLKNIIPSGENQLSHNVENQRSDNGTEFKNHAMNEFCAKKGIKREFSVARTPQQNGVIERKNKTLIEAARTMLADSLLPIPFWADAVNTACYVLDKCRKSGLNDGCRTRIPIEDVAPAAHKKPSESSPKDNDIQDSEDVIDTAGPPSECHER
ncbi:ribonuclease H-like domain-containing protein [Tanacetum coccineum]